ncbi:MAG: biopolymer transporter ExbD [Kiritimatiellae bacterium]|nr:biopolymer transporter ExbD [Kiritimatiellia bacterium]
MSRRHPPSFAPKIDMNLTSMSDLTFLLLITFIITFPMIEQGIPIKLPKGKTAQLDPQAETSVVTVDREGRVFLGEDPVSAEALGPALSARLAANPELRLVIRGDEGANYGKVVEVGRIAKQLGIERMAFATSGEE